MFAWIIFSLLVLGALLKNPLVFLFVPGVAAYFFFKGATTAEQITYIVGSSLSFWIISAWFMKLIGVSFFVFSSFVLIAGFLASPFLLRKLTWSKKEAAVLLFFILIGVLRFFPYTQLVVAPGPGDMSEHTYPVVLILWNNGIPDSYKPLLPIDHFGAYAAGFHTLAALFSWFGGIPEYQSTFFLSLLVHALISMGLYTLLRPHFSQNAALAASFVGSFFTTYPQLIFHWGGNPTVLSFFFVLLFVSSMLTARTVPAALFLAAALLTHVVPFLAIFYAFLFVYLIYFGYLLFKRQSLWQPSVRICLLFAVFFLFITPYLYYLQIDLKGEEQLFHKVYYSHAAFPAFRVPLFWELFTLGPIQSIAYTSIPLFFLALAGIHFCFRSKKLLFMLSAVFFVGICLLLINVKFWVLPFTFAFRSDRISMLFLIPFLIYCAALFEQRRHLVPIVVGLFLFGGAWFWVNPMLFSASPYAIDRTHVTVENTWQLGIFQLVAGPTYLFLWGMDEDSLVTPADITAFLWIRNNTPSHALFLNNKLDAGPWIPAIAYRPVVFPHTPGNFKADILNAYNTWKFVKNETDASVTSSLSISYFPTDIKELTARNISYVYIGSKQRQGPYANLHRDDFINQPDFALVYDHDGASVFAVNIPRPKPQKV